MKTWLICGSRIVADKTSVFNYLNQLTLEHGKPSLVIHGGAKGADSLGGKWATTNKIPVTVFPAQWSKYGRAAGPKRNLEMIEYGPDRVVAFVLGESRGTRHTIKEARERNIPLSIYYMED